MVSYTAAVGACQRRGAWRPEASGPGRSLKWDLAQDLRSMVNNCLLGNFRWRLFYMFVYILFGVQVAWTSGPQLLGFLVISIVGFKKLS